MNTQETLRTLVIDGESYGYHSLPAAAAALPELAHLPRSLRVLAENLLRQGDDAGLVKLAAKDGTPGQPREIGFRPARILMQDFTGVPAVADLAAMRDAARAVDVPVERINPQTPVDLVIDHSVMVDRFAADSAFARNVDLEFERNRERYEFLRWGAGAFDNFRVVPPGTGICHQVNLEHLAQVVWVGEQDGRKIAYPDTVVGTDSHTTMVNGLSVLGWGVGGIEAEAAMLGNAISMLVPDVVGVRLRGRLPDGAGATDLVLTVTRMLREHGVVGKFVEFFGPGVHDLPLADRATLANMAPEYGATCGFFPVDRETLRYLELSGRDRHRIRLVERYAKEQGLWQDLDGPDPEFTDVLELDLGTVEPSIAGPKRPQDRVPLRAAKQAMASLADVSGRPVPVSGTDYALTNGSVVIAAITSCTNTSNPSAMVAAGLLAKAARQRGLDRKPWVKTSLAPGSQVVTDYLDAADLTTPLKELGFHLVGYGCTTCIGNSGPLDSAIVEAIEHGDGLTVSAVLSGNRNFEGRIHPNVRANWLASPALVVAYAIAGTMDLDLTSEPLGTDPDGNDVFLRDLWPDNADIQSTIATSLKPEMFRHRYGAVFEGSAAWQTIVATGDPTYRWHDESTYVRRPPFFDGMTPEPAPVGDVRNARALLVLGDSVTTDHISPAGAIRADGPAGEWLSERQVRPVEFNSFGARRGNHEIMLRGTFGNIRIRNELAPGTEGGFTRHQPSGEILSVYAAAERYRADDVPLIVIAGREYGTGSSRDWAAKGTRLLGVRAVIAESFERIHRTNLIGMGVLPLVFEGGVTRQDLGLDGTELFHVSGMDGGIKPRDRLQLTVLRADGSQQEFPLRSRVDTSDEAEHFQNGGILLTVLRRMAQAA